MGYWREGRKEWASRETIQEAIAVVPVRANDVLSRVLDLKMVRIRF